MQLGKATMMPTDRKYPKPLNKAIEKTMKANRSKNTRPEQIARKVLREKGFPGYRLNWKKAPGKPDIAYPGKKIAIFINGCFWHRCPICDMPLPKTHQDYWKPKFEKNMARDQNNYAELQAKGWTTVVIWECQIKNNAENAMKPAIVAINNNSNKCNKA